MSEFMELVYPAVRLVPVRIHGRRTVNLAKPHHVS